MARTVFVVNDGLREKARHLAGLGVPQDDIAKLVGCAPKTLRKRFRNELDRGVVEANATVTGYLLAAAKAGNIAAIIFWLKTRAHWRERSAAVWRKAVCGPGCAEIVGLGDGDIIGHPPSVEAVGLA